MNKKTLLGTLLLLGMVNMNAQDYVLSDVQISGTAPKGISVKGEALYIAFSGDNKVVKTSLDGKTTLLTLTEGLNQPADVDCDANGRILVANQGAKELKVYGVDGTLQASVPVKKMNGDVVGSAVSGVTVGKDEKIYVAVGGSSYNGVHVYDKELKLVQVLDQMAPDNGIPGCDKLRIIRKVFIDAEDKMYIVDKNTGVIVVDFYDDNVIYPSALIKREGSVNKYNNAAGIVKTSTGNLIFSLDTDKKEGTNLLSTRGVYYFAADGTFEKEIGENWGVPYGLAINSNDDLYVADSEANKVVVWKKSGSDPSGLADNAANTISCYPGLFSESLTIEVGELLFNRVELYDVTGCIIYSYKSDGALKLVIPTASLPRGMYLLRVDGKAYGSKLVKK